MTFTIIADEKNPSFLSQIFHMSPKILFPFYVPYILNLPKKGIKGTIRPDWIHMRMVPLDRH